MIVDMLWCNAISPPLHWHTISYLCDKLCKLLQSIKVDVDQDAHIVILSDVMSTICSIIRHQAGKQVSRLKWFCMMAYKADTKE